MKQVKSIAIALVLISSSTARGFERNVNREPHYHVSSTGGDHGEAVDPDTIGGLIGRLLGNDRPIGDKTVWHAPTVDDVVADWLKQKCAASPDNADCKK